MRSSTYLPLLILFSFWGRTYPILRYLTLLSSSSYGQTWPLHTEYSFVIKIQCFCYQLVHSLSQDGSSAQF